MNIEMIKSSLSNIKPGTFTRITYISELPLKAEYKKMGYKINKITSITTRFGIHYGNISGVEPKENNSKPSRVNNYSWIVKNNICYNSNTEKYYLCTYPTSKGVNPHTKYSIKYPDGSFRGCLKTIDKDMVINSYWNKTSKMMRINIDNIIKIGGDN